MTTFLPRWSRRHILALAAVVAVAGPACAKGSPAPEKVPKTAPTTTATSTAQGPVAQVQPDASAPDSAAGRKRAARVVKVYYFHTTYRCQSCNTIEKLTREAVDETFPREIKDGAMSFQVVNVEQPANQHFAQDYQLYTKSVIVSDLIDGKEKQWKNLDQVWTLLRDPVRFKAYVVQEVKTYLKG